MKIKAVNILLMFLVVLQLPALDLMGKVVVSGYVRDAASGEELIDALKSENGLSRDEAAAAVNLIFDEMSSI